MQRNEVEIHEGPVATTSARARAMSLMAALMLASGVLTLSACEERSAMDEAVEEVVDEVDDAKQAIEDEVDDHS